MKTSKELIAEGYANAEAYPPDPPKPALFHPPSSPTESAGFVQEPTKVSKAGVITFHLPRCNLDHPGSCAQTSTIQE